VQHGVTTKSPQAGGNILITFRYKSAETANKYMCGSYTFSNTAAGGSRGSSSVKLVPHVVQEEEETSMRTESAASV